MKRGAWHADAAAVFSTPETPWRPTEELNFGAFLFPGRSWFSGAVFEDVSVFFVQAQFRGPVRFEAARFQGNAGMIGRQFAEPPRFHGARFDSAAAFATPEAWGEGASFAAQPVFHGLDILDPP